MRNSDLLSTPSFGMDPTTLIPSHTGGLLDLPNGVSGLLQRVDESSQERLRRVALQMIGHIAASDVPASPYGPAAHLLELAESAIRGDGRARYEGCRLSLEEEIVFAGLYGLDSDPAEATVLLGATHLLASDPRIALRVAYGMVSVRRARYEPCGLDAGYAEASRAFASLTG